MKPFLPAIGDPWAVIYVLALMAMVAAVWALRGRPDRLSAIMVLDWFGTRLSVSTFSDNLALSIAITDISCILLILVVARTGTGLCVASLFAMMLTLYAALDIGIANYAQTMAMVDLLAYLQLVLIIGGAIDAHLKRHRDSDYPRRSHGLSGPRVVRLEVERRYRQSDAFAEQPSDDFKEAG